jgi:hypothetical protein
LFHWRASDLSLQALTGQTPTLYRAATGSTTDTNGTALTVPRYAPRWTAIDTDSDTTRDTVALGLGSNEYLKYDSLIARGQVWMYCVFWDRGGYVQSPGNVGYAGIGETTGSGTGLSIFPAAGGVSARHFVSGSGATATSGVTLTSGDRCEALVTMNANGRPTITVVKNTAAAVSVTAGSDPSNMTTVFSPASIYVGSFEDSVSAACDMLAMKIGSGTTTLTDAREAL